MNAGLPGAGLGGLFLILCAIVALPIEIIRAIRGRGSRRRSHQAFQHTLVALAMSGALFLTYRLVRLETAAATRSQLHGSVRQADRDALPALLPIAPMLLTLAVLAAILALAAAHLVVHRLRHS
jgi:sterol desaturase/sphingolipid hydroxylase (fatty acid hydroxylase superfamily)